MFYFKKSLYRSEKQSSSQWLACKWLDQVSWPVDLGLWIFGWVDEAAVWWAVSNLWKFWWPQQIFNVILRVWGSYSWVFCRFCKFICVVISLQSLVPIRTRYLGIILKIRIRYLSNLGVFQRKVFKYFVTYCAYKRWKM